MVISILIYGRALFMAVLLRMLMLMRVVYNDEDMRQDLVFPLHSDSLLL